MAEPLIVDLPDLEATTAFGRRLGALLFPGAVVALVGPLGAGKTHLVRSIADGLGADPRRVSSPTFALIHEYAGRLPIYHFDTYRLPGERAFVDLGVDEYFAGGGVCLVEWADRVTDALPADRLTVVLEVVSEASRRMTLTAIGPQSSAVLAALRAG